MLASASRRRPQPTAESTYRSITKGPMSIQPTLLMIADIAGYTRFMKFHYMSLVHAQEVVAPMRERASNVSLEMDDLGSAQAYYVDLHDCGDALPAAAKLPVHARLARHVRLICRSVPYILGLKKPCVEFRNVPDAARA